MLSMSMTACPNRRCKCSDKTIQLQIINTKMYGFNANLTKIRRNVKPIHNLLTLANCRDIGIHI